MAVNSTHPRYRHYLPLWQSARDCLEGGYAVKNAGVKYLPRLKGQSDEEYAAYKGRALFYSITSKTLSALTGMALDDSPEVKYPAQMASYFEDMSGLQFIEVLHEAVAELLLMGRFGVLVDRPVGGGKPYLTTYTTEDIINWHKSDDGKLQMVVLREYYMHRDDHDRYIFEERVRYRKLEIVEGQLEIEVFESRDTSMQEFTAIGPPTTITNTGLVMDSIPFFCVTPLGMDIEPVKPPMMDIVDINLSHYRTSADLEHGRHFTGLPTPYIIGGDSDKKMYIGSTAAWVIPEVNASVGYLEFTGQGLTSLENALKEKQAQLASLSARLIDNSSKGSEAAETVRLRYLSETSSLKTIVVSVQALANTVFNAVAAMEGLGTVSITLNTNFLDSKLSAAEINAWTDAYLKGTITKEIYIHNLKRGRALPPPGQPMGDLPDPPPIVNPEAKPPQNNPNQE